MATHFFVQVWGEALWQQQLDPARHQLMMWTVPDLSLRR